MWPSLIRTGLNIDHVNARPQPLGKVRFVFFSFNIRLKCQFFTFLHPTCASLQKSSIDSKIPFLVAPNPSLRVSKSSLDTNRIVVRIEALSR